jgi:hypothetical protein
VSNHHSVQLPSGQNVKPPDLQQLTKHTCVKPHTNPKGFLGNIASLTMAAVSILIVRLNLKSTLEKDGYPLR